MPALAAGVLSHTLAAYRAAYPLFWKSPRLLLRNAKQIGLYYERYHVRRFSAVHAVDVYASSTERLFDQELKEQEIHKIDLRVGRILSVEPHPEADELYVEQIDLGEAEPRTIISGLRKYVSVEDLQGRSVIIVSNLKPRNMRGIKSNGMLLCATNDNHSIVDPLSPPKGACIGERIFFGEGGERQAEAASPNQVQKKKIWEICQPLLKTNDERVAEFGNSVMLTTAGPVISTLRNANIS